MKEDPFVPLRSLLMERLETDGELSDPEITGVIDELLMQEKEHFGLCLKERIRLSRELFYSVRKMDVLQELLDDPEITEIMVNGPDRIFVEKDGRIRPSSKRFTSRQKLEDVVGQIVGRCNRVVNESQPIVDARLSNGDRVNVVVAPAALNGPILTIRRFPKEPIGMDKLIRIGSITEEAALFLKKLVEARYSILIGGGTGCGKTTFLSILASCIPRDERIITVEDNAELRLMGIDNLVRLEEKQANMEGGVHVSMRDLIKAALRMRPDRIIVGEVRGAEAFDLLTALNTGHDGSLSTAHANSCQDMISRIETMTLMGIRLPTEAIRRSIASGIDLFIHLGRLRDRSRKVLEIAEVIGYEDGEIRLQTLYQYVEGEGLCRVADLTHTEKLQRAGIVL